MAYFLPRDAEETERLSRQLRWTWESIGGHPDYILPPIEFREINHILDVGCGSGVLLYLYYSKLGPHVGYHGLDLSDAQFMANLPLEIQLRVHDLREPIPSAYGFQNKFDLVTSSYVLQWIPSRFHLGILTGLYDCIRPGGWVQLIHPIIESRSFHYRPSDDPDIIYGQHCWTGREAIWNSTDDLGNEGISKLPLRLAEAGFTDVGVHEHARVKFGQDCPESVREISIDVLAVVLKTAVESALAKSPKVPIGDTGLFYPPKDSPEFEHMMACYRKAMAHGMTADFMLTWAQRPVS